MSASIMLDIAELKFNQLLLDMNEIAPVLNHVKVIPFDSLQKYLAPYYIIKKKFFVEKKYLVEDNKRGDNEKCITQISAKYGYEYVEVDGFLCVSNSNCPKQFATSSYRKLLRRTNNVLNASNEFSLDTKVDWPYVVKKNNPDYSKTLDNRRGC